VVAGFISGAWQGWHIAPLDEGTADPESTVVSVGLRTLGSFLASLIEASSLVSLCLDDEFPGATDQF
jgi:hypothetical protein